MCSFSLFFFEKKEEQYQHLDELHSSTVRSILEPEIHTMHSAYANEIRVEAKQKQKRASDTSQTRPCSDRMFDHGK